MSFNRDVTLACAPNIQWLSSYLDDKDRVSLYTNTFFAGGMFTSIIAKEKPKDYDVFFSDPDTATLLFNTFKRYCNWCVYLELLWVVDEINPKLVRGSLVSTHSSFSVDHLIAHANKNAKKRKNEFSFISKNAMSLDNGIQLIFRFVGQPEEVFSTFDYEHCKVAWQAKALGLTLGETTFYGKSLDSLAKNELVYSGNTRFVLSALSRLNKFIKRGWGIAPSSLLSLAISASKVNWSDKHQLEEELLGIYGIDPQVLTEILSLAQSDKKIDLDKVIEMLGEV